MDPLRVNARLVLPPDELSISFARAGGPGGQNVNKVATKVVLRFDVAGSLALGDTRRARIQSRIGHRLTTTGELVIHASRFRERGRNVADARERMAEILREALEVPRTRRSTRPTAGSKRRRLEAKRRRGQRKRDRGSLGDG